MFPTTYTEFKDKRNASYDGDPQGDYVLAEHMNTVQDAIELIERAIGLAPNSNKALADRIKDLESVQAMRVPAVGYFAGALGSDTSYLVSILSQYQTILLSERSGVTAAVIAQLKEKNTTIYGQVNGLNSLTLIQNEIGAWKTVGAQGIYLMNLGEDASPTRSGEQDILSSIEQAGMKVFIESTQIERLIDDAAVASYNPAGDVLIFPKDTTLQLDNFAYNQRAYTGLQLMNTTKPLIEAIRAKGLKIAGFAHATNQDVFNYVQATALLFGLDVLHNGPTEGYTIENRSPVYNWPSYLMNWKTTAPLIFREGNALYRDIPNGRIWLYDDLSIKIDGYELDSTLINWYNNTIPGSAIQEGSIEPGKLSTYDIQRIVELLNNSNENIQINSTKIKADEGGGGLPINIPSSNMMQNVIEAINKKNNIDTPNTWTIENWAIESLDAAKLTGDLKKDQIKTHVIAAINESSDTTNYIDVPKIKTIDMTSTGTIDANVIVSDNGTIRAVNVTEALSAFDATVRNYFTGNEGEFYKLYVEQLTVDKLMGLKELHVETLTADNMGALVLSAIDANITNGTFVNIVTQALKADSIKTDLITALNSITDKQITNTGLFGTAVIDDASIKSVSAGKLTAGSINTALINLSSPAGHLNINDSTMKIYDDLDAQGQRKLRVLIGDLSSLGTVATKDKYGMVVLGEDGSTRLYDNTGVYNAGLHNNVISENKIQDDAISERVIQAGAIITEHLQAGIINADKIGADAILAKHILAGEITGGKIAGETITGGNIKAGAIQAGHIEAGSITATQIAANSITADKLTIGFLANLIRDGYDSFEQSEVGNFKGVILAGTAPGVITKDWSFDGDKSFYLMGNSASNRVRLAVSNLDYTIPVMPGNKYFVSAYVKTNSISNVPLTLGLAFNTNVVQTSTIQSITKSSRVSRISYVFTAPTGALRASVVLGVEATNVGVWFDCLQVEEMTEGQTEAGFWKSTATTKIDGANITTGYIDASHIHIGGGTLFGTNSDIIDITDEGIKAKSQTGWAMLNSKGIEIVGGAFNLTSGTLGQNSVTINGKEGITTETSLNRIEMNATTGFRIIDKAGDKVLLDTDPQTGAVRIAGSLRIYDKDNPAMSWSMQDKINNIEGNIDTVLEDYVTALDLEGLQSQIDGSISSFFGTTEPTLANVPAKDWTTVALKNAHIGDLYYDEVSGYSYRFVLKGTQYSWTRITDSDITLALEIASKAQDTADGKRRMFVNTPVPPYDIGDLWAGGGTSDLMKAVVSKATGTYVASDWGKAVKYTDDTTATAAKEAAATAKGVADKAEANALTANNLLGDISSDSKLTAAEKSSLKVQWDSIVSEFEKNKASAVKQTISTTAYHNAYTSLSGTIGTHLNDANLKVTTTINGTTLRAAFKSYYDQRQVLLEAITDALNQKSIDLGIELGEVTSDNKLPVITGNPIYTNKSDDAVVHVAVDGLSEQIVGSGRNLAPGFENWELSGMTSVADGILSVPVNGGNTATAWIKWDGYLGSPLISYDVVQGTGFYFSLTYFAEDKVTAVRDASNQWTTNGVAPTMTPNTRVTSGGTALDEKAKWIKIIINGTPTYTPVPFKLKNLMVTVSGPTDVYESPVQSPDYPIAINSLDKSFDIVSSTGLRNLLLNSNFESKNLDGWSQSTTATYQFLDGKNVAKLGTSSGIYQYLLIESLGIFSYSFLAKADSSGVVARVGFLNGVYPQTYQNFYLTTDWVKYTYTTTIPLTTNHIFHVYSVGTPYYITDIKVEKAESSTPYSQAIEDISYNTKTPTLYKTNILLSEPLRSVGDVKDRVFLDADGLWKVERNVGEYILNENTSYYVDGAYFYISNIGTGVKGNEIKSTHFPYYGKTGSAKPHTAFSGGRYVEIHGQGMTATDLKNWLTPLGIRIIYGLPNPTIETLSAEQQTKLNNIASFKGSNYVYTMANVTPNLRAQFKSTAFYRYESNRSTINNLRQSMDATKDVNIGMLIGYSSFSVQTSNSLYFCGLKTNEVTFNEEVADIDGSIFNRQTKQTIVVPKQAISLAGVPAGTSGYIIWDNTSKKLHFTYYTSVMGTESKTSSSWKNQSGAVINLTDSVYVIGEIQVS